MRHLSSLLLTTFILSTLFSFTGYAQGFQWAHSAIAGKTATDNSGNIYTLAWFNGTVDFDAGPGAFNLTAAGNNNMFVLKEDPNGNFLWVKQFGGPGGAPTAGIIPGGGIAVDSNDNIFIAGNFKDSLDFDPDAGLYTLKTGGAYDAFVVKLNSDGSLIWAKASNTIIPNSMSIYDMKLDASSNVYLAATITSTVDVDLGPNTIYFTVGSPNIANTIIEKIDSAGNYVWAKQLTGDGNNVAYSLDLDPFSNIYITGTFANTIDFDPGLSTYNLTSLGAPLYGTDSYIAKWDSAGVHIWTKQIGGPDLEVAEWITVDKWSNPTIAGYLNGTADFDPSNAIYNLTTQGSNAFNCRLSANGDFRWANSLNVLSEPRAIASDTSGNIFIAGSFEGSADFAPGSSTYIKTSSGSGDIYTQVLDTGGQFKWAISAGNSNPDGAGWIDVDNHGYIYITGGYSGFVDIDPGPGIYNLSSTGNSFKLKLCPSFPVILEASDDTACAELDTIILTAPTIAGATYTWAHDGNTVQTGGSNILQATESGYYEVTVTGAGCPSTSDRVTLEFMPTVYPALQTVSLLGNIVQTATWHTVGFNAIPIVWINNTQQLLPLPYYVVWSRNGVPFDTTYDSFSNTYMPIVAGTDTITAVLTSLAFPCADTAMGSAIVVSVPSGTANVTARAKVISVYPNPAKDMITISALEQGDNIQLTDLSGRVLKSWANGDRYDIRDVAAGYYMLRVTDEDGRLIVTKGLVRE